MVTLQTPMGHSKILLVSQSPRTLAELTVSPGKSYRGVGGNILTARAQRNISNPGTSKLTVGCRHCPGRVGAGFVQDFVQSGGLSRFGQAAKPVDKCHG